MGVYKRISGIYCITNILNNKKYVGYSNNVKKRWNDGHRYPLRRGIHKNDHLQKAWNIDGENMFTFSILETLSFNLTKEECEKVETKWVLKFNSHQSEFGYNSVLPGSIPLYRQEENITKRKSVICKCIDPFGTVHDITGIENAIALSGIKYNVVIDLMGYWRETVTKKKRKSRHGWIIVPGEIYDESFNYVDYKKTRSCKGNSKKTWRDYYKKEEHRKSKDDIIPYSERNLKRIPILAKNVNTGEEKIYPMIKDCIKDFMEMKVRKCINNEFGKYQHRGYYFKILKISN